jgi:hypothetical protein
VSGNVIIGIKIKKPGKLSRAFDLLRVVGKLFGGYEPKHPDRQRGDPEVLLQQHTQAARAANTVPGLYPVMV